MNRARSGSAESRQSIQPPSRSRIVLISNGCKSNRTALPSIFSSAPASSSRLASRAESTLASQLDRHARGRPARCLVDAQGDVAFAARLQ